MLPIELRGEQLQLLPQRAIYWPAQKALLVADLHWGKSGHFRKHGIAIPGSTQTQDEIRLATLIATHKAERLIIAGDMFHSRQNAETDLFSHWRKSHAQLHIDFITGNHDILPQTFYHQNQLTIHPESLQLGPFHITHDMPPTCTNFCIHGHIHPAARISGKGRSNIKLDCFCIDQDRLILPAFGNFTGNHIVAPALHRHIYIIAGNEVIKWG
jgi:uncharacterized protein